MPREAWVLVKAVVSDTYPDQGLPGPQPPSGGGRPPGYPSHPIYYPPYPDQGLPPFPSQGLPGQQPRPDQGLPPFPSHPIYIPITPPPESGLEPTHPIYIPVYPDQGLPGPQPRPDQGLPGNQPYPDQGLPGNQPYPDNTLPRPTPGTIAQIKKVVDFWTGNLPPSGGSQPHPEPIDEPSPDPRRRR
jgi:hypothetical protein